MWGILPATASAVIAAVALIVAWAKWREESLRRGDVLIWTNQVIRALQSLVLVCIYSENDLISDATKLKLTEVIFDTSTLVEQGRMFFRNDTRDGYGQEKKPAYRGYRPKILDPIVLAHQVATAWSQSDETIRAQLGDVALQCLKEFVSLAQMEVGRDRSAAVDPSRAGEGIHLKHVLDSDTRNLFGSDVRKRHTPLSRFG